MNKWRYAFNCRNCLNCQYVKDEIRDGMYCIKIKASAAEGSGYKAMHADDDYVVRCDDYSPMQMQLNLFEAVEEGDGHDIT